MNNFDEINNFFMNKLIWKVLMRWKNWGDFKGQDLMNFREEDWSKIKTLFMNSQPEFRIYRMKLIVMNDSRDFQHAESVRSGQSHVSRYLGMPSRNNGPPSIWGHTWKIRKDFCKSNGVFFSTLSARIASMEFIDRRAAPFIHSGEKWKARTKSRSEMSASQDRQPEVHSTLMREDSQRIMGKDQQRLQISDPYFDRFPNPATFVCWKVRFKIEVCICSHIPTDECCGSKKWSWLIQWLIGDFGHLLVVFQCRILKYLMRGLLRHWTESSIIPSSKGESVWRNKKP